jgi:hypothetical protein
LILDEAIARLEQTEKLARSVQGKGAEFHERYARGQTPRPMVRRFADAGDGAAALLSALRQFRAAPAPDTWPFCRFSIHLDGLVIDPCSHHVVLAVSDDGRTFEDVLRGPARMPPSLDGEFVLSAPLEREPRIVRLEVGGFASLAFTRVRMETLEDTRLPARIAETSGIVRDPDHLLTFDRRIAVFNEADVIANWLRFDPLPPNYVVLEF